MPEAASDPILKYLWQQAVFEAFIELRPEYLPAQVKAAERAISARLSDPNLPDLEEQLALRDALRSLRVLFPQQCQSKQEFGEKRAAA